MYGVRFGPQTAYAMIDIDKGSSYHPRNFPAHIEQIKAKLAAIGLTQSIAINSSMSGGIHLYFPIDKPIASWKLAETIEATLKAAGFKIKDGQLETFPNARNSHQTLYKAHRLPLQFGSHILSECYEPEDSDSDRFVRLWEFARYKNDLTEKDCDRILKSLKRQKFKLSTKAENFLNDLNAEIEHGWTGPGQTNQLLGRIAQRSYIFGHILHNLDKPLEGRSLIEEMVRVAIELPGYQDYCGHQHEISDRCKEWADCITKSKYFPCGIGKPKASEDPVSEGNAWNLLNAELARDRIRYAVKTLSEQGVLSVNITSRYHQLKDCGIGGETLYKYLELWHPNHLNMITVEEKSSQAMSSLIAARERDANLSNGLNDRKYLESCLKARDSLQDKAVSDCQHPRRHPGLDHDYCPDCHRSIDPLL